MDIINLLTQFNFFFDSEKDLYGINFMEKQPPKSYIVRKSNTNSKVYAAITFKDEQSNLQHIRIQFFQDKFVVFVDGEEFCDTVLGDLIKTIEDYIDCKPVNCKEYYDREETILFYKKYWGGESIHIGLGYPVWKDDDIPSSEDMRKASRQTIHQMINKVQLHKQKNTFRKSIDLGAAYGDLSRELLKRGLVKKAISVDIGKHHCYENIQRNEQLGISSEQHRVIQSSFCTIDVPDHSCDLIISNDAFLHAGEQWNQLLAELQRIATKDALLVFSDPMQTGNHRTSPLLVKILKRLDLDTLRSPDDYKHQFEQYGWKQFEWEPHPVDARLHYEAVYRLLQQDPNTRKEWITFKESMEEGLDAWIKGLSTDILTWGFLVFSMTENQEDIIARNYYDDPCTQFFYETFWGGENIHVGIGLPETSNELSKDVIIEGSRKTYHHMVELARRYSHDPIDTVCDLGAGYGNLCREFLPYCRRAYSVEISQSECIVNTKRNEQQGISPNRHSVLQKSYFETELPDKECQLVLGNDAWDHAGENIDVLLDEIARITRKDGLVVFTDLMQSPQAMQEKLTKVYNRIKLKRLMNPQRYIEEFNKRGFRLLFWEERQKDAYKHYSSIYSVLKNYKWTKDIPQTITQHAWEQFQHSMLEGLEAWIKAYEEDQLSWGFFVFKKHC